MNFIILEVLFLQRGVWTLCLPGCSAPGAGVGQFLSISITTCGRLQIWPEMIPLPLSLSFDNATLHLHWDHLWPMVPRHYNTHRGLKSTYILGHFFSLAVLRTLRPWGEWAHVSCYGMNCVPPPKFIRWSPKLQRLRMWLDLEIEFLK